MKRFVFDFKKMDKMAEHLENGDMLILQTRHNTDDNIKARITKSSIEIRLAKNGTLIGVNSSKFRNQVYFTNKIKDTNDKVVKDVKELFKFLNGKTKYDTNNVRLYLSGMPLIDKNCLVNNLSEFLLIVNAPQPKKESQE